jgi:DNA-binding SARP family transcriptional activator
VIESGQALFRLLGPLEAWTGQDWAEISAPKQRSLLATLLLYPGQLVPTDVLSEELWPGGPPANPGNLIAGYVHYLRKLIGDPAGRVLVTGRVRGYQIMLGPGQLDAGRFARLVADGGQALAAEPDRAAELLTEALGLWRGRPLADVYPTQLIAAEVSRLEESRVEAVELLAEAQLACGRPAQMVPELRRLVTDWPLREKLWSTLIRALYGAGRQAEALEAYAQAREAISEELGVDPGAELRQLYQQILNADGAEAVIAPALLSAGPVPAQLPADIVDFTGRAGQVEHLQRLLVGSGADGGPGAVQVALVVGSGGLGKTALAVHVAHQLAGDFADGQLYANLHGATRAADPAEILARFLRDLGADPAHIPLGEEERAAQYRTRLAGKRVLIFLDDARDSAQVGPLLPGSASCAVLVTARRRLPELAGTRVLDLDEMSHEEATALLTRVAGEERIRAEPAATDEVLNACAGLPLAIRIAGARLAARGSWNVRYLADRLVDERRRLDELRAGNLAVRASFEVSFASLPGTMAAGGPDPAHAFRLLGLWTGSSISLAAAAALLGLDEDSVADALDVLVDAHLLESRAPDRFRFHDLLRVYAADRARTEEADADRLGAITRVLAWYLHTTEATATVISPQHVRVPLEPPPAAVHPLAFTSLGGALAWCETERAALAAAVRLAAETGLHEVAWKLAAAAMSFYFRRSQWSDWVTTHQAGLASARALGDRRAEAWMLNNLGMAYGVQHMEESVSHFEQALAIYRDLGDLQGESRAATNVANAYFDLSRFGEALEAAQRSLAIQRRAKKRYGEGIALTVIGSACRELGRFSEAIDHLQAALAIFRELGDRMTEADALSDLGEVYLGLNRVEEAIGALSESLAIWRDIGARYGQAETLQRLARAQQLVGDTSQARESLEQAVLLFAELGDHARAAEIRRRLPEIA